ncbi:MAG TPA: carboxyl transferase domain-containing protein [Galbitalea sp.]
MKHLGAIELIDVVLDADSFASWDEPIPEPRGASEAYLDELAEARRRSGGDEAVITGRGLVRGMAVAVIVSEFRFLGGSVGVACANRIEAAVRRATAEGLPLLAAPASGGTRMQEGTVAFVQMIRITAAIIDHRAAGLPYLVYLRHPTMGGVFASWGLLGHITVAEPGALLGFLGPKVFEALSGTPFPDGVQTAENLAAHGLIDAVVRPDELADLAARVLTILALPAAEPVEVTPFVPQVARDVWESITVTRDPRRPGARDILRFAAEDAVPLFGTSEGEQQPGLILALANLCGVACVVIGQDRVTQRRYGPIGPDGLRQVRRGIRLAAELDLPLVTIIDTPGARLSRESEEGGLAGEIARCLVDLLRLPTPTVALLLGEGGGGGALALLPADRILATENAWLSPLPPEGASAIVHDGSTQFAAELAELQGVAADRLVASGIVDALIDESALASRDYRGFAREVARGLADQIFIASTLPQAERLHERSNRFHRVDAGAAT